MRFATEVEVVVDRKTTECAYVVAEVEYEGGSVTAVRTGTEAGTDLLPMLEAAEVDRLADLGARREEEPVEERDPDEDRMQALRNEMRGG